MYSNLVKKSLLLFLFVISCGKKEVIKYRNVDIPDLNFLKDPSYFSKEAQKAATAVVKISDVPYTRSGTGFFISKTGLLMTNEHVLGTDNCLRQGCYVNLTFDYQRSIKYNKNNRKYLFAIPVAVNKALDFTIYQIYSNKKDHKKFTPRHHLKLKNTPAQKLINKELFVVGHSLGHLKKMAKFKTIKTKPYLNLNQVILPGASGSPLLDKNFDVVGIVHSSLKTDASSISLDGIKAYSLASPMEKILKLLKPESFELIENEENKKSITIFKNFSLEKDKVTIENLVKQGYKSKIKWKNIVEKEFKTNFNTCTSFVNHRVSKFSEINLLSRFKSNCLQLISYLDCKEKRDSFYYICPKNAKELQKPLEKGINYIINNFQTFPKNAVYQFSALEKSYDNYKKARNKWFNKFIQVAQPELSYDLISTMLSYGLKAKYENYNGVYINNFMLDFKKDPNHNFHLLTIARIYINSVKYDISTPKYETSKLTIKTYQDYLNYIISHRSLSLKDKMTIENILYKNHLLYLFKQI